MSKKNFDIYLDLGASKIRVAGFDTIENNQIFFLENNCLTSLKTNLLDLSFTDKILEKTILEIEKKTGEYLNSINLMLDSPDALSISLSVSKKNAIIVGTSSFGKGTVQTVEKLPNNGEIILTWSQFVAPSGYYIQGLGVRPTICISDTNFSLTETLERTLVAKETIRQTLRLWRSIKPKLPDPNLRETCPAKKQASSYGVEIARHIIKSPDKYNQLLNISADK